MFEKCDHQYTNEESEPDQSLLYQDGYEKSMMHS